MYIINKYNIQRNKKSINMYGKFIRYVAIKINTLVTKWIFWNIFLWKVRKGVLLREERLFLQDFPAPDPYSGNALRRRVRMRKIRRGIVFFRIKKN